MAILYLIYGNEPLNKEVNIPYTWTGRFTDFWSTLAIKDKEEYTRLNKLSMSIQDKHKWIRDYYHETHNMEQTNTKPGKVR